MVDRFNDSRPVADLVITTTTTNCNLNYTINYDGLFHNICRQGVLESFNESSSTEDADFDSSVIFYFWLWKVITPTVFTIFAVSGTIGNGLVVYVVISRPKMRNVINVLLVSLALADIAFLVVCAPSTAYRYAADSWPFGDAACQLVSYLLYVTTYVTVYTLVAITGVRFASVVCPERTERFRTKRNAVILAAGVWAFAVVGNLVTLPKFIVRSIGGFTFCGIEPDALRPMLIGFFTVGYVIPLTAIGLLNVMIVVNLAMRRRGSTLRAAAAAATTALVVVRSSNPPNVPPSTADVIAGRSRQRQIRTVRILLPLVLVFGLSWLPLHVQSLVMLNTRLPQGDWYEVLRVLWNCLAYGNSVANPFIYHRGSKEFRQCFREVLSNWIGWMRCFTTSKDDPKKSRSSTKRVAGDANCPANGILSGSANGIAAL